MIVASVATVATAEGLVVAPELKVVAAPAQAPHLLFHFLPAASCYLSLLSY